jgi:hypothetical protein
VTRAALLDLAERVGWTFLQALAGAITAGGEAAAAGTFDWRSAVVGALVAAVVCALKVLGVTASTASAVAVQQTADQVAQRVIDEVVAAVEDVVHGAPTPPPTRQVVTETVPVRSVGGH